MNFFKLFWNKIHEWWHWRIQRIRFWLNLEFNTIVYSQTHYTNFGYSLLWIFYAGFRLSDKTTLEVAREKKGLQVIVSL